MVLDILQQKQAGPVSLLDSVMAKTSCRWRLVTPKGLKELEKTKDVLGGWLMLVCQARELRKECSSITYTLYHIFTILQPCRYVRMPWYQGQNGTKPIKI